MQDPRDLSAFHPPKVVLIKLVSAICTKLTQKCLKVGLELINGWNAKSRGFCLRNETGDAPKEKMGHVCLKKGKNFEQRIET